MSQRLRCIDLDGNQIGFEGARALIKALTSSGLHNLEEVRCLEHGMNAVQLRQVMRAAEGSQIPMVFMDKKQKKQMDKLDGKQQQED